MGVGTLFSQHPRRIALFALSILFQPFPGSSIHFHPQNGARMALDFTDTASAHPLDNARAGAQATCT
jgi:hypothetical protein